MASKDRASKDPATSTDPAGVTPKDLAPPPRDKRRWIVAGCFAWVALQILVPLRYYAGDDTYDERFAWRMFSAVRVQRCSMQVVETRAGRRAPLQLMSVLPAPWTSLMERNRPAVVEGFLSWRCADDDAPDAIEFQNVCMSPAGEALPAVRYGIDCESGALTRPAPAGGERGDADEAGGDEAGGDEATDDEAGPR